VLAIYSFAEPELEQKAFSSGQPVLQVKHSFWIKFSEEESRTDYLVSPKELFSGISIGQEPQIIISGSLILRNRQSASKCQVKLPSSILLASNKKGETIRINLQGKISNKPLSNEFVTPTFDSNNEAHFEIEGFVNPDDYLKGLRPGDYNFKNNLKLTVEFKD
jgi:hypothetical protein